MMRALMLRRTTDAYVTLFRYLNTLMPNFKPRAIKSDFEEAQMNAWRIVYHRAKVEGCLWHYAVAVFNKAKQLGLSELIRTEPEVASIVRSLSALPLLPAEGIEDGLIELGWEARDKGWMLELRPLFQYMETEWIPKAQILSVKGSDNRTNNISESANRSFNRVVRISRPNSYQVIREYSTAVHTCSN
ncbi:hypothetical protein ONE63_003436 [Megalurothrips usitatus]|uniref:Transposase n=1 Tax=Megalurothrips usitatus TaxID=439358 RepID=A0AAV7X810_9NEOP|nr:hypothetical protein ONE63_003436 [Megalurothrips usitatus]